MKMNIMLYSMSQIIQHRVFEYSNNYENMYMSFALMYNYIFIFIHHKW